MAGERRRIGRPRVIDRPGFLSKWATVYPEVAAGRLSHGAAARRLDIGYATLLRLLRRAGPGEGR